MVFHCSLNDTLKLRVWDEDLITADDPMGKWSEVLSNISLESGTKAVCAKLKHGEINFELTYTALAH
jgi:hypothetical protein